MEEKTKADYKGVALGEDQATVTEEERAKLPFVSVVIPVLNEERNIESTLRAVIDGSYPRERYEIIVVDNGSGDRTVAIARQFADQVICLSGARVSASRNVGVAKSKGTILAFLDADCLPCKQWLQRGVRSILHEPCVTGSTYDVPENASWIETDWFCQKENGRRETTHINAGNLFVQKNVFEGIGGFNESLTTGEDTEFCIRAREVVPVISDDRISVVHLGNPKTLKQFVRREIWYGLGALGSFKVDWRDKPLAGTVLFAFFSLMQLVGVLLLFFGLSSVFIFATAGLVGLLALTVFYRRRYVESILQAVRLALLYYLFYFGRTLSFWFLLRQKQFYHQIKKEA